MTARNTLSYEKAGPLKGEVFFPPFCPNPVCPNHSGPSRKEWFLFRGVRKNNRHGMVSFYLCCVCRRSFSSSSFLITYYEKVVLDYNEILSFVRRDISLTEWADRIKTSPGTLKLRICKLVGLLLQELSEGSLAVRSSLLRKMNRVVQQGGGDYRVLRDIIFQAKSLLEIQKAMPDSLPQTRPLSTYHSIPSRKGWQGVRRR